MQLVLIALSTLFASVPILFALALVWWSDRYDREPLWLVLLTFFWGAIGAVFLALPLNTAFGAFVSTVIAPAAGDVVAPHFLETVLAPSIGAPLIEEPSKALFLLFLAWNRRPNDMSSGFVYGAAAGLGFAMTENFVYFTSSNGSPTDFAWLVLVRTLYCTCLHAMTTSVVGASFGFARLRSWPIRILSVGSGLLAAMALHALWNGLLSLNDFSPSNLELASFLLLPIEVLFVLIIWQLCLFDDSFSIRRYLQDEEDRGTLPADASWKIASWWRRAFQDIAPQGVDSGRYIRTATSLARRKRELVLLGKNAPDFYRDDVRRLRRQLQMLTTTSS